jgi:phytoene dehydrogenase-like protein
MSSETIVIGGGLGGLCTAGLLAQQGLRVTLFERAAGLGGRARSRTEAGFTFNLGAHAMYLGGPSYAVLGQLGITPHGKRVAGVGAYAERGGHLHALPASPLGLLTSDVLTARGKVQVARLFASLGFAGLGRRKQRALSGMSVRAWLDQATPDPSARALVELLVRLTTYANAPELLGADIAAQQLGAALRLGVMYVDGGWQSLVDAAERRARELGVRIAPSTSVRGLRPARDGFELTLEGGRAVRADAVVAAIEPPALARLLPADAWAAGCAADAIQLRAACLDVGVRALPHPERINVLSLDAPLYYANHAAYAAVAPAGAATLQLVRYLAPGEDGQAAEPELRAFLERMQPGVLASATSVRFLPNLVVHHDIPGRGRAGLSHPEHPLLCAVSDQAHQGGVLLDGVLAAAAEVSSALVARMRRGDDSEAA